MAVDVHPFGRLVPYILVGEDDTTPNIAGGIDLPVILSLISKGGEDDISSDFTGGVHHPYDMVPNIQGARG